MMKLDDKITTLYEGVTSVQELPLQYDASVDVLLQRLCRYYDLYEHWLRNRLQFVPVIRGMAQPLKVVAPVLETKRVRRYVRTALRNQDCSYPAASLPRFLETQSSSLSPFLAAQASSLSSDGHLVGERKVTGLFLNECMRELQGRTRKSLTFMLHTACLDDAAALAYIGLKNKGSHIFVKGHGGAFIGYKMRRGTIHVQGNGGLHIANYMLGGSVLIQGDVFGVSFSRCAYGMRREMRTPKKIPRTEGMVDTSQLGTNMRGGMVVVDGSLDGGCGRGMSGGTIIVKGDVGGNCGFGMSGGKIIVEGDVYGIIGGRDFTGGEIHIRGEYCGISNVNKRSGEGKGKLYLQEKRVW